MSKNELDTTIDDWRAEIEQMNSSDPGKTAKELAEEFNIPRSTMHDRLQKLVKIGRCKKGIGKRIGVGGVYTVSVYQLIPQKKAGK